MASPTPLHYSTFWEDICLLLLIDLSEAFTAANYYILWDTFIFAKGHIAPILALSYQAIATMINQLKHFKVKSIPIL